MTNPDGPVHPQTAHTSHGGISLREDFSARIMASLMASYPTIQDMDATEIFATVAVRAADALIRRLNGEPNAFDRTPSQGMIDLAPVLEDDH